MGKRISFYMPILSSGTSVCWKVGAMSFFLVFIVSTIQTKQVKSEPSNFGTLTAGTGRMITKIEVKNSKLHVDMNNILVGTST